jgi:hypothetical protein
MQIIHFQQRHLDRRVALRCNEMPWGMPWQAPARRRPQ